MAGSSPAMTVGAGRAVRQSLSGLVLLYVNFGSIREVLLAAREIPMAPIGGIFTLYFTGTPFSASAAIGFVALFGIAARVRAIGSARC
jgi:Cu/Ag efflux pump CusA